MLTIAIQAGGQSRRMGQDKGLLPFLGQPLIARALERLAPIAGEMLVTTNRPQDYRFLGVPLFPDLMPGRGALGGLYTALSVASQPLVAVVACDMPFINPDLLAAQRDLLLESAADIVIPQTDRGLEPFHAVYCRETCLSHVAAAVQADQWRVDSWFQQVKLLPFTKEQIVQYDPQRLSLRNINTPEELEAAMQLARELEI